MQWLYLDNIIILSVVYSCNGGAIKLSISTFANITRCHFKGNKALGNGGAIYVTMKSEIKLFDSQFTMNTASSGGSVAVFIGDSFLQGCSFTSGNATEAGGCILLKAANGTVKQSYFSGCQSKSGGTIAVTEQAMLLLDAVAINESHSLGKGGALYVSYNSDLLMKNSVVVDSKSKDGGGIYCSDRSRMYLDAVLIRSCFSYFMSGCVHSSRCNVTMNNIIIPDVLWYYAIFALVSTINIYNTLTGNDAERFLWAHSSHVSFWNFNMSGSHIYLKHSVVEFQHTLFIRQDEKCPIRDEIKSTINFKSVYVTGPTKRIVCKQSKGWSHTVMHGSVSGKTFIIMVFMVTDIEYMGRIQMGMQTLVPG